MPYGLPKELDTPSNNQWMEECVRSVMNRGKEVDKPSAVKICKSRLVDKKGNKTKANIAVINDLLTLYSEQRKK